MNSHPMGAAIQLRVTDAERQAIQAVTAEEGRTISEVIRARLFGVPLPPIYVVPVIRSHNAPIRAHDDGVR